MIVGDKLDMSAKELNTIYVIKERFEGPGRMIGILEQPYHKIVTLDELSNKYNGSDGFRELCLKAGYKLTALYPVYHQGWEMDEWAATAVKDGKKWFLTTNHGSLEVEEAPRFSFRKLLRDILGKI